MSATNIIKIDPARVRARLQSVRVVGSWARYMRKRISPEYADHDKFARLEDAAREVGDLLDNALTPARRKNP